MSNAAIRWPVSWQSIDGQDVDVVVLLAIRTGDHEREHMRNLAQLSRLMMQESFRLRLRSADDGAVVGLILQQLATSNEKNNIPPISAIL
jgi:mannitol/fructose-specific phosphotransferase system IIA component (Ntr-type)